MSTPHPGDPAPNPPTGPDANATLATNAAVASQIADGAQAHPNNHLQRRLTTGQVSMIGLSGALGTGLFLGSGSVIGLAGPATVISYMMAGMMALSVVWALAEMVSVHPVPGGHGTVASSYLGRFGGYVTRWNFAITMLVAVGAEVTAAGTYLQFWFPDFPLWAGTTLCSAFIVLLNLLSVRLYGVSEYWFSMIKVVAIIGFILLGAALVFGWIPSVPAIGTQHLTGDGGFAPFGVTGILAAMCMGIFSFGGIENVSVGAAESKNPQRDVPRAASTMIWRLLLFYVFAILVVLMLQSWQVTAASGGTIEESPFVKALYMSGVGTAAHIMNMVLIVAALSATNGCLYSSSRMIYALAKDGEAPKFAAKTSRNGTPRFAVMVAMVGMIIAAVLSITSPGQAFMWLYGVATVGVLVTWVMTMLTHLAFRRKREAAGLFIPKRRLWGAPFTQAIVIVACIGIYIGLIWLMPVAWYAGVPYLIVLTGSYWILSRRKKLAEPRDLIAEELAGNTFS